MIWRDLSILQKQVLIKWWIKKIKKKRPKWAKKYPDLVEQTAELQLHQFQFCPLDWCNFDMKIQNVVIMQTEYLGKKWRIKKLGVSTLLEQSKPIKRRKI